MIPYPTFTITMIPYPTLFFLTFLSSSCLRFVGKAIHTSDTSIDPDFFSEPLLQIP